MHRFLKILFVVGAVVLLLFGALWLLIQNRHVQNYLVDRIAGYYSEKLGANLQIESVDVEFFNKVSLQGVKIDDRKCRPMIRAGRLVSGLQLWDLVSQNQLTVTALRLEEAELYLRKDTSGVLNLQFLIDAFSKEEKKDSRMKYKLRDVELVNCRFSFDDEAHHLRTERFDAFHVNLSRINARLCLDEYRKGVLQGEVKHLSFKEHSGFELSDLKLKLSADSSKARIRDFCLRLPHSELNADELSADYVSARNSRHLDWKEIVVRGALEESRLSLSDLASFVPRFRQLNDEVRFASEVRGTFTNLHLKNLGLRWNDEARISLPAVDVVGLPDWKNAYYFVKVNELGTSVTKAADLAARFAGRPVVVPDKLRVLGNVRFNGTLSGYLDDLVADGLFVTSIGSVDADLQLSFDESFSRLAYNGKVAAKNLHLDQLLGETSRLGTASFLVSSNGTWRKDVGVEGSVSGNLSELDYRGYLYHDIKVNGRITPTFFEGLLDVDDPNLRLRSEGRFAYRNPQDSGSERNLDLKMKVENVDLAALHFVNPKNRISLSGDVDVHYEADQSQENTLLSLLADRLTVNSPVRQFRFHNLRVDHASGGRNDYTRLYSDLGRVEMQGDYELSTLLASFRRLADHYLPSLRLCENRTKDLPTKNRFTVEADDIHVNDLLETLGSNLRLAEGAFLRGSFDESRQFVDMRMVMPRLTVKKRFYDSLLVELTNPYDIATLNVSTRMNGTTDLALRANAANDSVFVNTNWNSPEFFYGSLLADLRLFRADDDRLMTDIAILPSSMSINGDVWKMHESRVLTDLHTFDVTDFSIDHDDQFVHISGRASQSLDDKLNVDLEGVQLAYIMELINIHAVNLEAVIDGTATVYGALGPMVLDIDADASDFMFNGSRWGDVRLLSKWDSQQRRLHADGYAFDERTVLNQTPEQKQEIQEKKNAATSFLSSITKMTMAGVNFVRGLGDEVVKSFGGEEGMEDLLDIRGVRDLKRLVSSGGVSELEEVGQTRIDTVIRLSGDYYPGQDSLEFIAVADRLPLNFLRRYLTGIAEDISGEGTGRVRIFGSLKRILMESDVFVQDGTFRIGMLNTTYHFTDTLRMRHDRYIFDNVEIFDGANHRGMLNGEVTHDYYKNVRYDLVAQLDNMKALDLAADSGQYFYGRAYATGRVNINGYPGRVNIDANVTPQAGTRIFLPLFSSLEAADNSFVRYIDRDTLGIHQRRMDSIRREILAGRYTPPKPRNTTETNVNVTITAHMTPDADVTILTSNVGDQLVARGTGDLKLRYSTHDDMKLDGTYEIEGGKYVFTLQNIIRKEFSLLPGGMVRWMGKPEEAIVNLSASYTVPSASLADILDESEMETITRSSVPVNCLLFLTGEMMQPNIRFDLSLPSDDELQRKIKAIVSSDEMMNREILSLLVIGTFYRPEYVQNSNSSTSSQMTSVLSTTVSGQLNTWLSQISNSNKLNVGINAKIGGADGSTSGGEYEVALMYQPNNRLIINSNLGYRADDYYSSQMAGAGSNFIGDIDVEYKLTKNGRLRAKAYNHTADNYYYNISGSSFMTQGVGLLYKEEFNTFRGLMRRYFGRTVNRDSISVTQDRVRLGLDTVRSLRIHQPDSDTLSAARLPAGGAPLVACVPSSDPSLRPFRVRLFP